MKYIFVSGGVVSGLGKGIITASLSFLLKSRGFKVTPVKVDMYFNVDAGTLRPQEHGEVFVTHDGMETDEDLGHYERFVHENLKKENYITAGQIYSEVIRKERAFEYSGETVDVIPHVTDEIIRRITYAGEANKAEIVVIEYGGTVGEYKNGIFFEAARILKLRKPKDVIHVHVTYLPYLAHIGELKSKPAQTSVHILNGMGIQPDIIVARSEKPIDKKRADKLALFCNIPPNMLFNAPDLDAIYQVPLLFHKPQHHFATACLKLLGMGSKKHKEISSWQEMTNNAVKKWKITVKIAIVGKYFVTGDYSLIDSYVSVVEALRHASWQNGVNLKFDWIDSEKIEKGGAAILKNYNGLVVPQGWGSRGTEGKVIAIEYARKNKLPYLGLCFGMQMAVIEFARNVLGLKGANTTEADPDTKYPVIHIMPNQLEYLIKKQYGGTIRLGAWPCYIKKDTKLYDLYGKYNNDKNLPWNQPDGLRVGFNLKNNSEKSEKLVFERHRHRYEFNNKFKKDFEKNGFVFAGHSPDGELVEAIEIKDHPFYIGTQFHPEYMSRPLNPHPIFLGFVEACKKL
ncbi:CTP synthetase [candidate division WWE3 bacterium RIFCSPHIGHO2_12_FULL_38_15]|uniref:CTP synthase (glutamine hydrolyzing) n=1 Tax=candidate division WWE3 bacterium RIFCSPHIGHO2_02_FULL_38_14 TaxID=1802620 RepID=A0A1F4V8B2_UNCKA|nr:MAG: CTP synthetase [candidate division WWE3 bacterium RIFCSPHIGHO2_01_FULL_38_45]OGC48971.1 MAG: CTP synthetase [candidate division WWE3 bacterium RIFCSPHIGHO2_12_FULL_38_15]OGC52500.1 MAG: CTP synthetase [candidate division WWE3 bacterium RIFCSPLOWO2_01_FULL_37_24]OGC53364.1 MAG: CTP synthetase [candidate division WWE3 bacterium RIFCSPHIGHO2_02_FULL_38_14]